LQSADQYLEQIKTPALRLVLERLELNERGKKSEDHFIPDGLHIEHVLPQQWSQHWPLKGTSVPQTLVAMPFIAKDEFAELADAIRARNEKLHTLGNLSLLNRYLNPAASNGSFELKKNEYANSVLRLNRYFDGKTEWDEKAIEARGKSLCEKLCKIWPSPSKALG
jgi:hypothetical protein